MHSKAMARHLAAWAVTALATLFVQTSPSFAQG